MGYRRIAFGVIWVSAYPNLELAFEYINKMPDISH